LPLIAALLFVAASCGNSNNKAGSATTTTAAGNTTPVAQGSVPGVTADEIRFAALGTETNNPLGTCMLKCFTDGLKAYFAYRNSTGGLDGRKLVLSKVVDDQLGQNKEGSLEIISANDTFATFENPTIASGLDDFVKAGIPVYLTPVQAPDMNGKDSVFANREVLCIECAHRWYPYAAKLAGAKKIGILAYGIADASKKSAQGQVASFEKYGNDVGAHVVYQNEDLPYGLPNGIGPEVTAMKNAGVDMIFTSLDLNATKALAHELQRQGIRDKVTIFHPNLYDQSFVKAAGDLFDGDYVQAEFRPFEADPGHSSLSTYMTWMKKQNSDLTEYAMIAWIDADLAYQGIKAAGKTFDRASVIAATNKMTNYTADGLTQPIDWSRQHTAPTEADPVTHAPKFDCLPLVRVQKGGTFAVVGSKTKPWNCWPGDTSTWSNPQATDFQ
jgi:hypothetical protein